MCSSASKSALPRASKKRRAKAMFSFADDIKECPPPCKPAFSPTGRHHEHDATQRALAHRPEAIHPSAWKRNSANFACTEFSEVSTLSLGSSRSWSLVPSSLTASDYDPPSCYVQRDTGDPGGALRGQEQRGQRYVFRRPHPPQRVHRRHLSLGFLRHQALHPLCEHGGWSQAVDADAVLADLISHMPREHYHPRFGRCVGRRGLGGKAGRAGGHGDDRAAPTLDHARQKAPHGEERGGEVGVDRGAPLLLSHLLCRRGVPLAASERGQHIDRAELLLHPP